MNEVDVIDFIAFRNILIQQICTSSTKESNDISYCSVHKNAVYKHVKRNEFCIRTTLY